MAREIPEVVRAVAGLAATVLDEARKLPETLPGLPVRLIGQAMQTSLRLQQQYSGLVARGDEVLTGLRGESEAGLATFDEDLPPARTSAFDRAADFETELDAEFDADADAEEGSDPVAEQLADELADDLAVADLPLADADELPDAATAAVLVATLATGADDMGEAEVAALPDDPAADAVTAVVDELAAEVVEEVAAEVPDTVPDEVLEDLTADTVAEVAEEETAVADAVAEELIADAVVAGPPPAEEAADVPTLEELTPEAAPEQTQVVDDVVPDVDALEDAAEELVDLGGPEAAESVSPDSDITDSAASDPLVPADAAPTDAAPTDEPAEEATGAPTPTSPVEGYDAFSIPALRGHLRAYPTETVADLLDYERATRARAPYVTLLQNRLEKLSIDRG